MKLSLKKYAKYVIYVLATFCLLFLLIFNLAIYPVKYKNQIKSSCNSHKVSPQLVLSIIKVESSFNPQAKSAKGAVGLMQILPSTAKWVCEQRSVPFGENMLYSPEFNIDVGTYYLSYLLTKFKNQDTAIVAYNAGEGTVKNWLANLSYSTNGVELVQIPYKETSNYLIRVKKAISVYSTKM